MSVPYHNSKHQSHNIDAVDLPRGHRTIRIPCNKDEYQRMLDDRSFFKETIDNLIAKHPELFPEETSLGYYLHGFTDPSRKLGLKMRRIRLFSTRHVYTIAPSFVMPYMIGWSKDMSSILFLRRFNVPFWALEFIFGRNAMYWYRSESAFGRNSIVGTTIRNPKDLPQHLSADEKHTRLKKQKTYIATTVGKQCILGASVCMSAGEESLTQGYRKFQEESKNLDPDYRPETVNTDGWAATGLAWAKLFPQITIILCFLHAFIKIRDRCKKKFKHVFQDACDKVWNAYVAEDKRSFCQRLRRLKEWSNKHTDGILKEKLQSLCNKSKEFSKAYDHKDCHRTSNMVDRLMRWMDQYLFNSQYFHGSLESAEQGIRAWAILRNFQPQCYSIRNGRKEIVCAAKSLNGFVYSDDWLENLIVSTSMAGYRKR